MATDKKTTHTPETEAEDRMQAETVADGAEDVQTAAEDVIEDAEVIEEIAPEQASLVEETGSAEPEAGDDVSDAPSGDQDDYTVAEPEIAPDEPETDTTAGEDFEPEEDVSDIPRYDPPPEPVAPPEPQVIVRKGGFLPMLLGGAAAAAIGFGASLYLLPEGWRSGGDDALAALSARLDEQASVLSELRSQVGTAPDLSPVEARLDEVSASVATVSSDLAAAAERFAALDTRLSDLEKRPVTEAVSPDAIAAFERELKALQDAMAAQRAEVEKIAAEAAQKEQSAEMTAQEALTRAAASRIRAALDAGTGFADAAETLTGAGVALPPILAQSAETGIATRAELIDSFPEAARAALAVARKDDTAGGIGSFLKTQFGARSLEPRDGDDADAVLSRAEAAVREGRLADALAEIDALPEPARAEMSDWLARANQRREALAAAETLAAETK